MKKLISVVLALAMILSLSAVAFAADTVTLYCAAPDGWTACNCYAWNADGNNSWPGTPMTKGEDGIWYIELDASYTNVIFNNGSGTQSADLTMPTDENVQFNYLAGTWGTYGVEVETPEIEYVTLYCNVADWGVPNAYWWGSNVENSGNWPGNAMTLVEGTVYSVNVPNDADAIIFNYNGIQTDNLPLPTDGKNMWNGSEWDTYTASSEEVEPVTYYLINGVTQTITVPAGSSANVVVDARGSNMILNVNGYRMFMDWWFQAGMMPTYPGRPGFAEAPIPAGNIHTITIYNSSAEIDQILDVTATADVPTFGTWDNPAELVMGENVCDVNAFDAYFYTWTATEDGKLTLSINTDACSDWSIYVEWVNENYIPNSTDKLYSDADPVVSTVTVDVTAGTVYGVIVSSANGDATNVCFDASFVPGETGGNEGDDSGEGGGGVGGDTEGVVVESGTDVAINSGYVANRENNYDTLNIPFTPDVDGILTVHMISGNPGWKYQFIFADGSSTLGERGTGEFFESFDVLAGQTYEVVISGYYDWEDVDATVSYELIFTAADVEQEEQKEEWVISDITLEIGDNDLTMEQNAENTIFEFTAPEVGTYTFTAPEGILIGNWNTTSFPLDMTFDKTNVLVWECTAAGQPIAIGVAGSESIILNVAKTADGEEHEQIVYEDYIVQHVPQEENMVDVTDVQINNVDITKPQTIVKDDNGFYHLGSVDGPIIYFNLSNECLDLLQAHFGGYGALVMRGDYTDADGNVHHYDFKDATFHYANVVNNAAINNDDNYENDNSLYPLTTDLMMYLQCYGSAQGWYNADMTPYDAIKGEHDADSAWLVSCVYLGEEIVDEPETPETPEVTPGTGDYSIAGLVVAMMAATAGAVIIGKKKEF